MAYRAIWRGLMTSLPLWPFGIGFLPYLLVRLAPANQEDSDKPPPPANHGCKLVAVYFWPRKHAWLHLALARLGWLVQFHAIFASYPLMVMALSVPFLGEIVGWLRWLAVDLQVSW